MAIKIKEEKEFGEPYENCIFCEKPTKFWNEKYNVPLCHNCSKYYTMKDLKDEYELYSNLKPAESWKRK